jgi:hypothetical protein
MIKILAFHRVFEPIAKQINNLFRSSFHNDFLSSRDARHMMGYALAHWAGIPSTVRREDHAS